MNINSSQNKSQDLNSSETNTDIGIDEDDISWEKDKSKYVCNLIFYSNNSTINNH